MDDPKKLELKQRFLTMHIKFAQSPISVLLSNESMMVINLPVDFNFLRLQIQEKRPSIKIRTWDGSKIVIKLISFEDGVKLLEALALRFNMSKDNLLNTLKKLQTLTSDNQYNKLAGEFYGWFKPYLPSSSKSVSKPVSGNQTKLELPT